MLLQPQKHTKELITKIGQGETIIGQGETITGQGETKIRQIINFNKNAVRITQAKFGNKESLVNEKKSNILQNIVKNQLILAAKS